MSGMPRMLFDDLEAAQRNRQMIAEMRQHEASGEKPHPYRVSHKKKTSKSNRRRVV